MAETNSEIIIANKTFLKQRILMKVQNNQFNKRVRNDSLISYRIQSASLSTSSLPSSSSSSFSASSSVSQSSSSPSSSPSASPSSASIVEAHISRVAASTIKNKHKFQYSNDIKGTLRSSKISYENKESSFHGVEWCPVYHQWYRYVQLLDGSFDGKYFNSEKKAARSYDNLVKHYILENSYLNFPTKQEMKCGLGEQVNHCRMSYYGVLKIPRTQNQFQAFFYENDFNIDQQMKKKKKKTLKIKKNGNWTLSNNNHCEKRKDDQGSGVLFLGVFDTEVEAAKAYDTVVKNNLSLQQRPLNFPYTPKFTRAFSGLVKLAQMSHSSPLSLKRKRPSISKLSALSGLSKLYDIANSEQTSSSSSPLSTQSIRRRYDLANETKACAGLTKLLTLSFHARKVKKLKKVKVKQFNEKEEELQEEELFISNRIREPSESTLIKRTCEETDHKSSEEEEEENMVEEDIENISNETSSIKDLSFHEQTIKRINYSSYEIYEDIEARCPSPPPQTQTLCGTKYDSSSSSETDYRIEYEKEKVLDLELSSTSSFTRPQTSATPTISLKKPSKIASTTTSPRISTNHDPRFTKVLSRPRGINPSDQPLSRRRPTTQVKSNKSSSWVPPFFYYKQRKFSYC